MSEVSKVNRNFKGVWIPKEIWVDTNLTWMEKLFITEINSLDADKGCFASNDYFSKFFGLSKGRCTQIIQSLVRKNYLSVEYDKKGKQIIKRVLRILNRGIKYSKQGYLENAQESNTVSNNTGINNKETVVSIISAFNEITGRKLSAKSKSHSDIIKARLKDGHSETDLVDVIKLKNAEWANTEYAQYIVPATLFRRQNFEKYLVSVEELRAKGCSMDAPQKVNSGSSSPTVEEWDKINDSLGIQ